MWLKMIQQCQNLIWCFSFILLPNLIPTFRASVKSLSRDTLPPDKSRQRFTCDLAMRQVICANCMQRSRVSKPIYSKPNRYCKLYLYKLLEKLCDGVASLMQSTCIIFQPFNCRFWNHPAFPRSHDIWRTWRASLAHWRHARHRTSVHPSRDRHPRHRLGLPCLQIPIRPKASQAQGLQLPWRKVVFKI